MLLIKRRPLITDTRAFQWLFLIICASLASSLFLDAYPRKLFYVATYAVVLFMAIKIKRGEFVYDRTALAVAGALILTGSVRIIWGLMFSHAHFSDVTSNYRTGGKIFLVSSLLAYFSIAWRHYLTRLTALSGFAILFAGLLATLGFSVHEHLSTGLRVQLLSDSAGTISYLMTALALTTMFMGYRAVDHTGLRLGIFLTLFFINTILLILTESRAGVLTLPVLYVAFFCMTHPRLIKSALLPLFILMAAGFTILPHSVWQRLDSISTEVSSYDTNNDTSIGARFSIWKGGFHSVSWSPIGQSPDDRTMKAREYITEHERKNPEAFKNVQYHLHDDILETLSLQGLSGVVSLLLFYLVLVIAPMKCRTYGLSVLPVSFIIFGLTDTVLIQSFSVTVICLAVIVSYALMRKGADEELNPSPVSGMP